MCQVRSGAPSALATSSASTVLPVPGSALISSGRSSTIEALTAIFRSSVGTRSLVPVHSIEPFALLLLAARGRTLRPWAKAPAGSAVVAEMRTSGAPDQRENDEDDDRA